MTGFAARPGTAVEPTCSSRTASGPRAFLMRRSSTSAFAAHFESYSTMRIAGSKLSSSDCVSLETAPGFLGNHGSSLGRDRSSLLGCSVSSSPRRRDRLVVASAVDLWSSHVRPPAQPPHLRQRHRLDCALRGHGRDGLRRPNAAEGQRRGEAAQACFGDRQEGKERRDHQRKGQEPLAAWRRLQGRTAASRPTGPHGPAGADGSARFGCPPMPRSPVPEGSSSPPRRT
jgi:hypothetical protein